MLTTEYPDAYPVFDYAKNGDLRKRMYLAYNNRAYPQNMAVLDSMIAKRHRLATLLGFPSWAEYITADKMVGSAKNASEFIDRIVQAAGPVAEREYAILLARKKQDVPAATQVDPWESSYYSELVRQSQYAFDTQKVRPYFAVRARRAGRARRHEQAVRRDVQGRACDRRSGIPRSSCYEMYDGGKLAGRFYLDMHPRANKYKHAAQFGLRTGRAGTPDSRGGAHLQLPRRRRRRSRR